MNLYDILSLKYPSADFSKDILLADYGLGKGAEIREWNLSDPKPTQDDLDQWAVELDLPYRQKIARESRKYPSIQDQLDMLYHDKIDGTNCWCDAIKAVKDACPIPNE